MSKTILDLIGNTPIIAYQDINIKVESFNPSGSIKDRPAYLMLKNIPESSRIIEATSGNMGISLAMIGKVLGHDVTIVMPDTMSKERRDKLKAYGAKVILSSEDGMIGAQNICKKLSHEEGYLWLNQFENQYSVLAHHQTGREIKDELPDVDYIVAGIGSGGTIMGIAQIFRETKTKIIGVEPLESPVLTNPQTTRAPHKILGIGAGFIPSILDVSLIDEIRTVASNDAIKKTRQLANEGYFLGISSAAAIIVAQDIKKNNPNSVVLAIAPDGGEKYMSVIYD